MHVSMQTEIPSVPVGVALVPVMDMDMGVVVVCARTAAAGARAARMNAERMLIVKRRMW